MNFNPQKKHRHTVDCTVHEASTRVLYSTFKAFFVFDIDFVCLFDLRFNLSTLKENEKDWMILIKEKDWMIFITEKDTRVEKAQIGRYLLRNFIFSMDVESDLKIKLYFYSGAANQTIKHSFHVI